MGSNNDLASLVGHGIKGRGAVSNATGRYESIVKIAVDDGWRTSIDERVVTQWRDDATRTIITRNQSPDIHFDRSINPYRGCEHGCVYCFARPTHTWLGHSAGLDFETRLYAKRLAPELLKQELAKPNYQCEPIAVGVNTDCYQPLERELQITRALLQVLLAARHPVYLITKSSLIERDIDLLTELAENQLITVSITLTTFDTELSRKLEPRATAPHRRLKTIQRLASAGIPTRVSVSPIIPALNEEEIDELITKAAGAGAISAYGIILRLPHELQSLFPEWLHTHYPLRANRVLKALRSMRKDSLNDARFGHRMMGSGPRADIIKQRFKLACKKAGIAEGRSIELDTTQFRPPHGHGQMSLF